MHQHGSDKKQATAANPVSQLKVGMTPISLNKGSGIAKKGNVGDGKPNIKTNNIKINDNKGKDAVGLTQAGVLVALGGTANALKEVIQDKKFKSNFMLKYPELQKTIQVHMDNLNKQEHKIGSDLGKAEERIKELKKPKP